MRPLKLELEGFTAFRNRAVIDFAPLDLFAICGPTGAGKSSLIDAISYALYGRIPRVNNEIAACISQGLDRLQVSLTFRAGENTYRVYRETRRKGAPNVRFEYLLAPAYDPAHGSPLSRSPGLQPGERGLGRDGADWQPLAQGAREVSERIEHILGLSYDGFTRSVLLPQGQFEEFLAGSPDKRRDVLRSLLRLEVYERMRDRASRLAGEYRAGLSAIETALGEQYADATPEALAARQAELTATQAEADRLATALEGLTQITAAAERFQAAGDKVLRLTADAQDEQAKLTAATALVDRGDVEIETLCSRLTGLTTALAANAYDDELLAVLTGAANLALALQRDEKALAEAEKAVAGHESHRAAAFDASAAADAQLAAAVIVLTAARAGLEEARRHDLAAAVQAGLKPGDLCPVCGGTIGDLPDLSAGSLAPAEAELRKTETAEQDSRSAAATASTAAAVVANNAETAFNHARALKASIGERRSELLAALPDFPDPSVATISVLLQAQKEAREERDKLRNQAEAVEASLKQREAALASARQALAVLTDRVNTVAAALITAESARVESRACLESILSAGAWPELSAAFGSGRPVAPPALALRDRTAVSERNAFAATVRLTAEIERISAAIAAAAKLREEKKRLEAEHQVAADLGQMLMANRFQAYVQAEALRLLAQDGSDKLRQLSNARYTLAVSDNGQEFEVVDEWNDGDRRSVRTLSGGETFLASLALALALAETLPGIAAGQRMALEAVFIDEGFGSLDAESLRLATDALDSLRTGGRMVCVVTHLPELAERLPARIEVTKSQTGSTAVIA